MPYICGNQFLLIVYAWHSDLTLTAHREVVGVGGDERHFCETNHVLARVG